MHSVRIVFVLPGMFVAGGVKFVLKISEALVNAGCHVTVVYPRDLRNPIIKFLDQKLGGSINQALGARAIRANWCCASRVRVLEVPVLDAKYLPSADFVFATAWQTAAFVNSLPLGPDRKCYLIQHYETWSGPKEAVDETWRLPMRKFVVAQWLADLAREMFNDDSAWIVHIGVDPREFFPPPSSYRKRKRRLRVAMLYHPEPWKGFADGLAAVEIARKEVDFDLVLFGAHPIHRSLPAQTQFYLRPSTARLRQLYWSSDVFVSSSWLEGGPMPPMEAMACERAVVATDSLGVREYAVHRVNALLSPPKKPAELAELLVTALKDEELRERLGKAGAATMKAFTWESSAEQMLRGLSATA